MIRLRENTGYDGNSGPDGDPEHHEETIVTAPDLQECRFLLRRRARQPFERWERARTAVEEAWRGGAHSRSERLARLEQELKSLSRDPTIARTARAREGLDQALDQRREERDAILASPEMRRHREALQAERAAREELSSAAAPYEWRDYEARLARTKKDHPRIWDEYEAHERAAGRVAIVPKRWAPLLPVDGGAT